MPMPETRSAPPHPGVRVPPPFLFAAAFLVGLALDRWVVRLHVAGDDDLRGPLVVAGWLGIAGGLAITGWGLITFRLARTSIVPMRPARTLVASGPYRFSRNPMYVGLSVLYAGLALLFDVGWPLLLLPFVLVALWFLVIRREERYLTHAFGDEYAQYRRRVRRWL
jgi:protein-S-isoprenylcysteine O-methyltransferase Ste14